MPRKAKTIEHAAYAAVGAADAATEVVKEKVVDLRKATKQARRRTAKAIDDAERRGRSRVGKIRKAAERSAKSARPKGSSKGKGQARARTTGRTSSGRTSTSKGHS